MKKLIAILVFVFGVSTAHASETDLIGTYAAMKNGQLTEVIKVTKEDGKFFIADKLGNGTWRKAKQLLSSFSREQFEKILKHKVDYPFDGLASNRVAVIKVPKGFQEGKFKSESGFLMFASIGLVELHKL